MAITVGTVYSGHTSSSADFTVTGINVPSDADICVLILNFYSETDVRDYADVLNFDGDSDDHFEYITAAQDGNSHTCVAAYALRYGQTGFPTRGATSQTLTISLASTVQYGGCRAHVFFLSGADTSSSWLIGTDYSDDTSSTWTSESLGTLAVDDLAIISGTEYNAAPDASPAGSGQTALYDGNDTTLYYSTGYKAGEDQPSCDLNGSYTGGIAFAIKASDDGTYVTNLNVPRSIGGSGFAADGGLHIQPPMQFSRVKPTYGSEALNADHPLVSNLVAAWLLNEGSGTTANDISGNNHNGTLTNFPASPWTNNGLDFDGADDYIGVPDHSDFNFTNGSNDLPFSIVARIYPTANSFVILSKYYDTSSFDGEWYFYISDVGHLHCQLLSVGTTWRIWSDGDNAITLNQWQTVAITYDGSESETGINLYVDGELIAQTRSEQNTYSGMSSKGADVTIGAGIVGSATYSAYADGEKSYVFVFDKELSASEVSSIHSEPYQMLADNGEAQLTNDITRHKQPIVLHEPRIFTGDPSNPTDYLIGWWKCDDNAASTTVTAEVGSDGTLQGGDNTADISSSDSIRGTSLLLDGAADYVDLLSAFGDLTSEDEWTLMFKVKPNFAYDVSTTQGIFGVSDGTDYLDLRYDTDMRFELQNTLGSLSVRADGPAYSSDAEVQQWVTLGIHLNVTQGVMLFSINGEIVDFKYGTMSWSSAVSTFRVGRGPFSAYGNMYIDEIKLYDGCILPFGAYFTGNGSVDTSVVHSDVLLYWDCESTNLGIPSGGSVNLRNTGELNTTNFLVGSSSFYAPGGDDHCIETVTNNDKIDGHKGSASFWIYCAAYAVGETMLYYYVDDNNYLRILVYHDDTTRFRIMYACNGTTINVASPTGILADSQWQHIRVGWADSDNGGFARAYVDGVEQITGDVTTAFVGDSGQLGILGSVASWGALNGGYMDQLYITNNPNTPQIPTVFGQPVLVPMIKVIQN